jgi:hypothetical protein
MKGPLKNKKAALGRYETGTRKKRSDPFYSSAQPSGPDIVFFLLISPSRS